MLYWSFDCAWPGYVCARKDTRSAVILRGIYTLTQKPYIRAFPKDAWSRTNNPFVRFLLKLILDPVHYLSVFLTVGSYDTFQSLINLTMVSDYLVLLATISNWYRLARTFSGI